MKIWLTEEEREQLTGYKRPGDQVRWLQENAIHHTVRADGWPMVPVSAIGKAAEAPVPPTGPRFDAIRRAG